jgi:hypothetical protein
LADLSAAFFGSRPQGAALAAIALVGISWFLGAIVLVAGFRRPKRFVR